MACCGHIAQALKHTLLCGLQNSRQELLSCKGKKHIPVSKDKYHAQCEHC